MKKLLFLLLFLPALSYAQVNLDSLWSVWNDETQTDTNRLKAMKDISWDGYLFTQPDSAFYFAQLQLDFAKEKGQKEYIANALYIQGISYYLQADYDKAINYYTKSLKIKEEVGDKKGIASSLNNFGLIYYEQGDYTKAIEFYTKSLKIVEEIGDKNGIASSLNNFGIIYTAQGEYAKAIESYTKSLKIQEEIGNKNGIATSLNNIGMIYHEQGDYNKAIESYTKSLKIVEEIGFKTVIAVSLNNIGTIYKDKGEIAKAMDYYTKCLKIVEGIGDKKGIANALNSIGGIYKEQGDYTKAMNSYTKSLTISEEMGDKNIVALSLKNIGTIYKKQGDYFKSIDYGKRSLAIAQEIGHALRIKDAAKLLWEVNKKQGKSKESLEMYELYIATRDAMLSEENQKAVIQQEYKYAYEKQKTIDDTEHDKLLALEKEKKEKQQILTTATAGGLGLVVVFLIFVFNRLRVTKHQKLVIESAHEELEEKNREIMDSITYAKRIQSAILPPAKLVKEYLKESFILYKPKDIVAGDFYWLEHKDGKVLFAAADCTGHGVPGAMVSVVCNNALNRSVREHGLTDPGQILTKTREIVVEEFEKSEEEVKDGMDIAICSLEGNKLQYAGAHNPLWIIRNGTIIETKANKLPIGQFDNPEPYTTHSFDLEKGDAIYIFSDGYVDQFGGEKGKKFKSIAFRELLLSIQDKAMEEQKTIIDESFESWRGDLEQIDDVCVIGVKI
jgi:serine phosphatase RsbU (regulator of sigma subunit)/tetratricopeptide (TPR) repeat protein